MRAPSKYEPKMIAVVRQYEGRIPFAVWPSLTSFHWAVLKHWVVRGWWEFGDSIREGWLTEAGKRALEAR